MCLPDSPGSSLSVYRFVTGRCRTVHCYAMHRNSLIFAAGFHCVAQYKVGLLRPLVFYNRLAVGQKDRLTVNNPSIKCLVNLALFFSNISWRIGTRDTVFG